MVLTVDEAAALLRVSHELVIDGMRTGKLPGNEIGGHWRVRRKSLLTWVDGQHGRP